MKLVFHLVLWAIGAALAIASRFSARVRGQLGRDFVFVVESLDGVARSYVINGRRVTSHSGPTASARTTVRFRTATIGTVTLLAPGTVDRIVDGFGNGEVECDGQASYVLWFYQLVMGLLPFSRPRAQAWPNRYPAPDPEGKAADRITREPAVDALAQDWPEAHAARARTLLWEVGEGAEPGGRFHRHRIAVDPQAHSGGPAA